jgi:hypothetical protein
MFPYFSSTHLFIIHTYLSEVCRTGWNSRFLENVNFLNFFTTEGTLREQSEVYVSFRQADGSASQVFNFTVEFHSCRSSWHVFSVRRSLEWVYGSMFRARVSWHHLTLLCINMAELSVVERNLAVSFLIRMYPKYYFLVRAVVSGRSPSTFHRDVLPPFSGSKGILCLSPAFTGFLLDSLSTLKKEAVCCSETWMNFYRTAPKDSPRHSNRSWKYQIQQNIPDLALSKTL